MENNSKLVLKNLTEGVLQANLAELNLRQVLDMGHSFQSINPSVKLKDMDMIANREDSRYFDVTYKLVALAVPAPPEVPVEAPPSRSKKAPRNTEEE